MCLSLPVWGDPQLFLRGSRRETHSGCCVEKGRGGACGSLGCPLLFLEPLPVAPRRLTPRCKSDGALAGRPWGLSCGLTTPEPRFIQTMVREGFPVQAQLKTASEPRSTSRDWGSDVIRGPTVTGEGQTGAVGQGLWGPLCGCLPSPQRAPAQALTLQSSGLGPRVGRFVPGYAPRALPSPPLCPGPRKPPSQGAGRGALLLGPKDVHVSALKSSGCSRSLRPPRGSELWNGVAWCPHLCSQAVLCPGPFQPLVRAHVLLRGGVNGGSSLHPLPQASCRPSLPHTENDGELLGTGQRVCRERLSGSESEIWGGVGSLDEPLVWEGAQFSAEAVGGKGGAGVEECGNGL